jgi:hypothetical protein
MASLVYSSVSMVSILELPTLYLGMLGGDLPNMTWKGVRPEEE